MAPVDQTAGTITQETTAKESRLPRSLYVGYGVGSLGVAIVLNAPAGLLAPFMTNFLGLGAATAAAILAFSKIYDMVTDPLMGILSDRTKSPWGRRRPYLLAGGLVAALGFVLMFMPPQLGGGQTMAAYMLLVLIISYTGYTLFNVPYLAMPAEMTDSYHERTTILSYRTQFAVLGMVFAATSFVLVQQLGEDGEPTRASHAMMALILAVVIVATTAGSFFGTKRARGTSHVRPTITLWAQAKTAAGNKPFLLLIGTKLCQLLGLSAAATTAAYFNVVVMGLTYGDTTWYLLTNTLFMFLFVPVWARVSAAKGKRFAYMAAVVGFVVVTLSWLLAGAADPIWMFYGRAAILGSFAAGILVMGPSLLPDTIEYDYLRTGLRREGIFAAFYTTMEKFSFAIGPAIVLFILSFFGYQSGTEGFDTEQSEGAITAIYIGFSVLPACAYGISLVFLWFYDLSEERLEEVRKKRPLPAEAGRG